MKIASFILAAFLFFFSKSYSQCGIDKTKWTEVFSEDFNGNLIDFQKNWKIENKINGEQYDNHFNNFSSPENFSISEGYGYFQTKKLEAPVRIGDKDYYYSIARIVSKHDDLPTCGSDNPSGYLYGMFEIRCKLPRQHGQYPSFWTASNTSWPPEIDAFEFNGSAPNYFFSSIHWGTNQNPQGCSNFYDYNTINLTDDFHTWTFVWTPFAVTWFFDGRELKTDTDPSHFSWLPPSSPNMGERCKWMKMNLIVDCGLNWPDVGQSFFDPFIVDYVKVYKPKNYLSYQDYYDIYHGSYDNYHDVFLTNLYSNASYKNSSSWSLFVVPSLQPYNVNSSLAVCQGGGKYYYVGQNNLLWITYWDGSQFQSAPADWSHQVDGDISLALLGDLVFYRKGNNLFCYNNPNGSFSLITYNPNVGSNVVANPNGLQVYFKTTGSNVACYSRSTLSSLWNQSLSTISNVVGNLVVDPNNFNVLYYRSTSNNIEKLETNNFWAHSAITTSNDVASDITISPDGKTFFYKATSGVIKKVAYDLNNNSWVNSTLLIDAGGTMGPLTNVKGGLTTNLNNSNLQLYFQGYDNKPWVVYWGGTSYYTAPLDNNSPNVAGEFQLIKMGLASVDPKIAYKDINNQVRIFQWVSPCEVLNPVCDSRTAQKQANSTSSSSSSYFALHGHAAEALTINHNSPSRDMGFRFYPNPTTDYTTFESSSDNLSGYSLLTMDGRIEREEIFLSPVSNFKVKFSKAVNGFYLIRINFSDGSKKTFQIMKQ